jgi:hypothetical protein
VSTRNVLFVLSMKTIFSTSSLFGFDHNYGDLVSGGVSSCEVVSSKIHAVVRDAETLAGFSVVASEVGSASFMSKSTERAASKSKTGSSEPQPLAVLRYRGTPHGCGMVAATNHGFRVT